MDDRENQPLDYRPPDRDAERFERNGWIGLAITLAVCTVIAILYLTARR